MASLVSDQSVRLEFARPWVRFPAELRCVLSSDPAVCSSIFVGAEREENLICMLLHCSVVRHENDKNDRHDR